MELDILERMEACFNKCLTVHMSDGRKFDFWAFGGECKATGGTHL